MLEFLIVRNTLLCVVLACLFGNTAYWSALHAAAPLELRQWYVDNLKREALVAIPESAKEKPAPVVFVFHGHGGTMRNAARMFHMHDLWPEAVCVYMQGLNTPGRLTDPEGKKPGWQHSAGAQGDRDLRFFDAVLASLHQELKVDDKRIFATGHSNGGGFTYLLWAERGDRLRAVAPSATAAAGSLASLKPKAVMHIAGRNDPLVKFAWQEATLTALRRLNKSAETSTPWAGGQCELYTSPLGAPLVTLIHTGNHQFPSDAPKTIAKFFQQVDSL